MFQYFHDLIFASTPARFESRYSLAESVRRLGSKLESPVLNSGEHAEGEVSVQQVCICRSIPNAQNAFKPVFFGSFGMENGKVILEGKFELPVGTRRTLALVLGALFCMVCVVLAWILWGDASVGALVSPVLFAVLLVLSASWGRVIGRDDEYWISRLIRRAIDS